MTQGHWGLHTQWSFPSWEGKTEKYHFILDLIVREIQIEQSFKIKLSDSH